MPHLGKNPRVGGGGAADHDGGATGLVDHARGVFGLVDVAVADDGDFHGLLDGGDDAPVRGAGVALLAGARMDGNGFDPNAFRHFGDVDGNDGIFVPAGAQFNSERNFDGAAHGFENLFEKRQIAEQAGAAALDDFFGGAAEIDVHSIVAKVFDHLRGLSHDGGIRAKKLRGNRVLVFLEVEIA